MSEKNIIRNPSPEDVEAAQNEDSIAGEAVKKIKVVEKPVAKKYLCKVKESSGSFFEPVAELFLLPSKTKVYSGPGITPDGSIYVRRFTTKEENQIQSLLTKENARFELTISDFLRIINSAINNCIISDVALEDLAIVDKVPLLIKLISMSYGGKLKVIQECTSCDKEYSIDINLTKDFIMNYVSDNFSVPKRITLKSFSFPVEVDLTIPTVDSEQYFAGDSLDLIKQFEALISDAYGTKPDGDEISKKDIPMIIEGLDKKDKETIKEYIKSFEDIGTNLELKPIRLCDNKKCDLNDTLVSPIVQLKYLLNQLIV